MDDGPDGLTPILARAALPFTACRAYSMAMVQPLDHYWTLEEVRALPGDGARHECIDGMLIVTPSPNGLHQRAIALLWDSLSPYVRRERCGELLPSPADIEIQPGTLLQPDLFVYRIPSEGIVKRDWSIIKELVLAVELLSPSTARFDRGLKRQFYLRSSTDELWIADIESRVVERWRAGDERPEILTDRLGWQPKGAVQPLVIALDEFFAAVHGENR
jgi:Uma2 family endonuclease